MNNIEKLNGGEQPLRRWKTPEELIADIEERKRGGKFITADEIRLGELREQINETSKRTGFAAEADKLRRQRQEKENENLGGYH